MWRRLACVSYVGLEGAFYALYRRRLTELEAERGIQPPHDVPDLLERVRQCCAQQHWGPEQWRDFLCRWFQGVELSRIGRENVQELMSYMLCTKFLPEMSTEEAEVVGTNVRRLERFCECTFPEGHNGELQPMRHTLDPFRTTHLPLAVYGLVGAIDLLGRGILRGMGFRPFQAGAIQGWRHPGFRSGEEAADPSSQCPLVLIPGMGMGLTPYLPFLVRLMRQCSPPTYVLTLPHVSLALQNYFATECVVPSHTAVAEGLAEALRQHGHDKACFVAQSYGTLYVTWLRKAHPSMVKASVLIDPVVFLIFEPDQISNLMYKDPKGQPLAYVFRHELYIRYMMHRHFWWMTNAVFAEDLPPRTGVLLSRFDSMVPTAKIYKYLSERYRGSEDCPKVSMFNTRHGYFLWTKDMQDEAISLASQWQELAQDWHHADARRPIGATRGMLLPA
eukprot:RCo052685